MADYFYAAGGSNTAPYDTWAKAATSFATALAAASSPGDRVIVQYDGIAAGDQEVAVDTTWTVAANNVAIICSTNSGTATITPTPMGTGAWFGGSGSNRAVILAAPDRRVYTYGLTLRVSGGTSDSMNLGQGDGSHWVHENIYAWQGNSNAASNIIIGATDQQIYCKLINPTFRFGNAGQRFIASAKTEIFGGSISSAGTVPTTFVTNGTVDPGGATVFFEGADLSYLGSNSIVGDATTIAGIVWLSRCKLGSGFSLLATQTNLNRSSAEVYAFDCSSGDTHGLFGYANVMGSIVSDTGIYFTSGDAAQSWKIVTTANCSYYTPFETPWIDVYNSTLSAMTPYFEILRDGSATAYQDDEVWAEFYAKVTSGFTISSRFADAMALAGVPANQAAGAGLGSWTGESGTAWSGKCDSGSAFTPAEVGDISGRIVVGEPSITVYLDPQIRT
jgi:hypothetical protein